MTLTQKIKAWFRRKEPLLKFSEDGPNTKLHWVRANHPERYDIIELLLHDCSQEAKNHIAKLQQDYDAEMRLYNYWLKEIEEDIEEAKKNRLIMIMAGLKETE